MLPQVLAGLNAGSGLHFIDCTVNGGGHAEGILSQSTPNGRVLGLDADAQAIARGTERLRSFGGRVEFVHRNFSHLRAAAEQTGQGKVHGILFDLGISSAQIAASQRGFSWQQEGPLDMRMDQSQVLTAATIVNTWDQKSLADIIWKFGEERYARRIARHIVEQRRVRPLTLVSELASVVRAVYGKGRHRIHPATRTFQALRIAVNRELENLRIALEQAQDLLITGGRLAVIAFHSLEDRIVKQFMLRASGRCVCPANVPDCVCNPHESLRILTRKPLRPYQREVESNPRSRSARLRIAERI
jgi:16S rRNA (cytosine1402-N4)-methyltransferase